MAAAKRFFSQATYRFKLEWLSANDLFIDAAYDVAGAKGTIDYTPIKAKEMAKAEKAMGAISKAARASFQRLRTFLVTKWIKNDSFEADKMQPLVVSDRGPGVTPRYSILDGGTRFTYIREHFEKETIVPCLVVQGLRP